MEEQGWFVIDKYAGRDTRFGVFVLDAVNSGFLRSISVHDRIGGSYTGIKDTLDKYNILSSYQVPFESVSVSLCIPQTRNELFSPVPRHHYL